MSKGFIVLNLFIIVVLIAGSFVYMNMKMNRMRAFVNMDMHDMRDEFIQEKDVIVSKQMAMGDYACCLEKPCMYCVEKSPKHGEGAKCTCLEDIVNGRHPCGECIGEILEGHGNPYLVSYFPQAIAEEVGEEHLEALKQIIADKYPEDMNSEEGVTCEKKTVETCGR